jgi:hypothetical protein
MDANTSDQKATSTLRDIYDSIESDLKDMKAGRMKVSDARIFLIARKAQLRTVEVALASQRLLLQFRAITDGKKKK